MSGDRSRDGAVGTGEKCSDYESILKVVPIAPETKRMGMPLRETGDWESDRFERQMWWAD